VEVGAETVGSIGRGLVVFLGVGVEDLPEDALYLAQKVAGLRIFEDQAGRMNLSLQEVGGAVLSVSQFTLYGDCRKGRRPSFGEAAPPERAEELYQRFNDELRKQGVEVATGRFQALMRVRVDNDGPVTILLDSRKRF
jgi:D-tyrosyl-tRNA(Tyr) deacylase